MIGNDSKLDQAASEIEAAVGKDKFTSFLWLLYGEDHYDPYWNVKHMLDTRDEISY